MTFNTLRKLSKEKLHENYAVAIALYFVVMLTYLCINSTGEIFSIFLSGILPSHYSQKNINVASIWSTLITLIIVLSMLSPLRLNIKSWYQFLQGEYHSPIFAFSYFTSIKKYMSALYFSVISFFVIFLTFVLPILPSIAIMGVINFSFKEQNATLDATFGVLVMLMLLLFILGIIFSIHFAIGFFFADYIYIKHVETNPFKAFGLSRLVAGQNRRSLWHTIILILPYYLLCLFIVPIPFVMPKIKSGYAIYADKILDDYLGGQNVNIS